MGIFKKFKTKECNTIACKILQRILFHTYTQILIAIGLVLISTFGFKFNDEGTLQYNLAQILFGLGAGYLVILAVASLIYAWIINPIRSIKERKNSKKN